MRGVRQKRCRRGEAGKVERGAQAAGGGRRIGADRRPGCRTLQILVPGRPDGARLGRGAAELHRLVMLGQLALGGVQLVEQACSSGPGIPPSGTTQANHASPLPNRVTGKLTARGSGNSASRDKFNSRSRNARHCAPAHLLFLQDENRCLLNSEGLYQASRR